MSRFLRAVPLVVVLAAVAALPAAGQARGPQAAAAATCKTPSDDSWGPTYVTSLTVTKTSCTTGKALVKAYYKCRVANGGAAGTCKKRVLGYRCTQKVLGRIKTEIDAKVTCTKGAARIVHGYTQFT